MQTQGKSSTGKGVRKGFNHGRRDVTGPYMINYQLNGSDGNCSPGWGEKELGRPMRSGRAALGQVGGGGWGGVCLDLSCFLKAEYISCY